MSNPIRAFLSYSTRDREIVEAVARELKRPHAVLDRFSFETGKDLLDSIQGAVEEAAIFVLFASRNSLSSPWVREEAFTAGFFNASGRLKASLVFALDDRINVDELPTWLRRFKAQNARKPSVIARVIRSEIDRLTAEAQSPFFVGRASERLELQAAFVPTEPTQHSNIVVVRGLPGVGRRTLIRDVARSSLQARRILNVRLEVGESATSAAAKLADMVEPVPNPSESIKRAEGYSLSSAEESARLFCDGVRQSQDSGELVVLCDEGGLLNNSGNIVDELVPIFSALAGSPDLTVPVVTSRRPQWLGITSIEPELVSVNPLSFEEIKQLLALFARQSAVQFDGATATAMANLATGYPPSVPVILGQFKLYGRAFLQRAETGGIQYNPRQLGQYLQSLTLSHTAQRLASILARNSPIPLDVLSEFTPTADAAIDATIELIDASIVTVDLPASWYRISDPVRSYIVDNFPAVTVEDYSHLADHLQKFLESADEDKGFLEVTRVLFRAFEQSGRKPTEYAYAMISDWIRLAEENYHSRRYEPALNFAHEAFSRRPTVPALEWKIRAQVKLGAYDDCQKSLLLLKKLGEVREADFLTGFMERHRGNYDLAIAAYERAKRAGRGGMAIHRDMADCYYHLGELETARKLVDDALGRDPKNKYLVSLRFKIALRSGDRDSALGDLLGLEGIDSASFFQHQAARFELRFGDLESAYASAGRAVQKFSGKVPPEFLVTLALCETLTDRLDDAESTVARIEPDQGRLADTVKGLRARILIGRQEFEEALVLARSIKDQHKPVHLRLLRDCIEGILDVKYVNASEKAKFSEEIDRISLALQGTFDGYAGLVTD